MQLYSPEIANGTRPETDALLADIAAKFNVPVPKYRVAEPMDPGVLAFYNTDDKIISFGAENPQKQVVIHEFAHFLHDSTGWHCQRKACEEFAYAFEDIYGKANNLYRHADCPSDGRNVYMRRADVLNYSLTSTPMHTLGLAVVSGALIYSLYQFGYKHRKPLSKQNQLKTVGLAAASAVGVGLVLLT